MPMVLKASGNIIPAMGCEVTARPQFTTSHMNVKIHIYMNTYTRAFTQQFLKCSLWSALGWKNKVTFAASPPFLSGIMQRLIT